jgi:hypothetical protein
VPRKHPPDARAHYNSLKLEFEIIEMEKEYISKSWETLDLERFPGPQPISIERRHFSILQSKPYLVCEKTDGVRHMLVCFENKDGKKICALVDRAFHVTYTTLTVPRDTILDGELLGNVFHVYDAIRIKGEDLRQKSLVERLAKANAVAKFILRQPKLQVKVKEMYPLSQIHKITLGQDTDGLIFTPVDEPVRMGTHETLFKWKPLNRITIDFLVLNGKDLHIQGGKKVGELHTSIRPYKPGTILECDYGKYGWTPVKERLDKTYPNNKRTFERTLVNIQENIQAEEFRELHRT